MFNRNTETYPVLNNLYVVVSTPKFHHLALHSAKQLCSDRIKQKFKKTLSFFIFFLQALFKPAKKNYKEVSNQFAEPLELPFYHQYFSKIR
jgi:hypothetical protein